MFNVPWSMFNALQQFGQLIELGAVRALDKDIMSCWLFGSDGCFHLLYILKLAEIALGVLKLFAYQPYGLDIRCLQIVNHMLMLLSLYLAEFAHGSKDGHLVIGLHNLEVLKSGLHR